MLDLKVTVDEDTDRTCLICRTLIEHGDNFYVNEEDDLCCACVAAMGKCQHANVELQSKLYRRASRFEPAEYLHRYVCKDCGEDLREDAPRYARIYD